MEKQGDGFQFAWDRETDSEGIRGQFLLAA